MRSQYTTSVEKDATCFICHEGLDDRTGSKSLTWAYGMPGVRAILCSPKCRDLYDDNNRPKSDTPDS